MKVYLPSIIMALVAFLFFAVPELAAVILGGGLLSLAIIYGWFTYRYYRYVREAQNFKGTHFEEEIFQKGAPTFKTISVKIFKEY